MPYNLSTCYFYDNPSHPYVGHAWRDKNRDNLHHDNTLTTFGSWVRTRRKQLDLTQAELGRRAACSEATIRKIEADERKPSRQLAELLARALLIPPINTQRFLLLARGTYLEEPNYQTTEVMPTNNNLPALLTSTINRVRDQTALIGLLKDQLVHLVTIIGPPGIGKTRLSIHCGNEVLADFPDGVWFVDLSEISDPRFLISSIAHSLTSFDLPPSPDLNQLVRGLRNRQLLLILDNFEQIAEEGAIDVARMLKNCPHIKILVTSRLPLHIYGENEYPLAPLTIPPPDAPRTQAGLKTHWRMLRLSMSSKESYFFRKPKIRSIFKNLRNVEGIHC